MGRICKNQITDVIRDQFRANPLRTPEARIKPMCMLEVRKNTPNYLGEFKFLTKGGFNHELPISEELVTDVSDSRSKQTDFKTGFGILGGFLKVLGVDPASVSASMKNSKEMAFTFSNVRRLFIDPLQFGQILSQNEIMGDPGNFMLQEALGDKRIKLALITDVIVSNKFSISTFRDATTAADIDVPQIANAVAGFNANVKVDRKSSNEVAFEASTDLTFAFTALELTIDGSTGKFGRGSWLKNLKSADGTPRSVESLGSDEVHLLERVMLDDNDQFPLLIEM